MCIVCLEKHLHITIILEENLYLNGYHLMSKNHEKEVLKAYDNYLAYFLDNDMEGINSLVKFPITYIADGESKSLDAFPIKPKEMMESKQWDTTIDTNTYTHGVNSTKGHVISSGTRIRKDKSVIEKYTVFYAFTKTDNGWKMYAISDVILD